MALAHLLEHAEPDSTPISSLPGMPPRFTKDVGRAVAMWWLAREQSPLAANMWLNQWWEVMAALHPGRVSYIREAAGSGLRSIADYLRESHGIALLGVLAPHGTALDAFRRAHDSLLDLIEHLDQGPPAPTTKRER